MDVALVNGGAGDGSPGDGAEVVTVTVDWAAGSLLPPQALSSTNAAHAVPDLNHFSTATPAPPVC
ncbi:hypothetical protein AB0F43_21325 [Kribbella sp. NPDC023972]|uniref:hypothetical protein n=1 Tax=Kribbella sp. NPDC023972 TaxID=3154795 RepID=UPI003400BFD6